jgi:hypothetical protein
MVTFIEHLQCVYALYTYNVLGSTLKVFYLLMILIHRTHPLGDVINISVYIVKQLSL